MTRFACLLLAVLMVSCGGGSSQSSPTRVPEKSLVKESGPATPAMDAGDSMATAGDTLSTVELTATPARGGQRPPLRPTEAKGANTPTVTIGAASFTAELAATPAQRTQGLSGRADLPQGTGMLFVFEREDRLAFWMKDMRFPLDMVWIGPQCNVVDITQNAPPPEPDQPLAELATYVPPAPAMYVLEINAEDPLGAGLKPGDAVTFAGALAGQYRC